MNHVKCILSVFDSSLKPAHNRPVRRSKTGMILFVCLLICATACSPPGNQPPHDKTPVSDDSQAEKPNPQSSDSPVVEEKPAQEPGSDKSETLVVGARLKNSPIRSFIEVSSDIESLNTVEIYPRLSDIQVTEILADEGDFLRKGDLLAKLDATVIELELAQAEVASLEAKHRRDKAELAVEEAAEREAKARVQASKAEKDFQKTQSMFENELVSEDEFARNRLTWEEASSELEIALLKNRDAALDLLLANTELQKREIDRQNAELKLSRTQIPAPFDGHVTFRAATEGMTVSPASHLFTLVDRRNLVAHLFIPQEDLMKVRLGMDVLFSCDAVPGKELAGSVSVINPSVDPNTGTVKIRAVFDRDEEGFLRPGMFVTARIITAAKENALLVPRKAVFYDDEKPTFFLIETEGTVRKIHFQPGGSTETDLEVASTESVELPVEAGTLIVIVGQDNLKEGDRVQVVKEIS
ncbi:MAG: efflux RND transporter periplasmic adaptor subunit [Planctomycetes bacterium]|nr:efflux RND transporter periplasmic adaptor subunit [Planctomycetota bacterium]